MERDDESLGGPQTKNSPSPKEDKDQKGRKQEDGLRDLVFIYERDHLTDRSSAKKTKGTRKKKLHDGANDGSKREKRKKERNSIITTPRNQSIYFLPLFDDVREDSSVARQLTYLP